MPKAPIVGRIGADAVWTGDEVIVWGGVARSRNIEAVGDGAAYDPAQDSWRAIAQAPSGVLGGGGEGAAWAGAVAVFWAGNSPDGPAAGGVYDPAADTWERLPDGPLGPREGYVSVWTGTELLIIAGTLGDGFASPVAAAVDPVARSWRLLPGINEFPGLIASGAVWDGHDVFVAGTLYLCPELSSGCTDTRSIFLAYDLAADRVHEVDLTDAPMGASSTPVGWDGSEVLFAASDEGSVGIALFDPATERWRTGSDAPCEFDPAGYGQTAWLGDRYVVPCGKDRLQIYDAGSDSWEVIVAGTSALNSRQGSAIAWTGTDLVVWSGVVDRTGNPTPNSGSVIRLGPV